jgi:hypothetical protein
MALTSAFAQTSSTTTTTTRDGSTTVSTSTIDGAGTITSYTPGVDYITFQTEASAAPVRYYYTKSTTIVDPTGKRVEWASLKPNMPVKYTYVKEGDRMVVRTITLMKPVTVEETTTTTTTQP